MLTATQVTTLKADIAATLAFAGVPMDSDGHFFIAAAYNQLAAPVFRVWKTDVPTSVCKQVMVWTEFIARSAGERDAWQFMLSNGAVNAANPNVRQGIQDIFSGPGGAGSRAALVAIAKRDATRAEKLFATGIGTEATPATMTFEGSLSYQDVQQAREM